MTRKQALTQAISMLSGVEGCEDTVECLQDIYDEMPFNHWTDKAIRDTVEQFILDNGRVPATHNFGRKGMPSNIVMERRYKMPLKDWLDQNYPNRFKTQKEIEAERLALFVKEYKRLKPVGPKEFNRARKDGVISWATAAGYLGLGGWNALISELKLPVYEREKPQRELKTLGVTIHTDMDKDAKKLRPGVSGLMEYFALIASEQNN